MNASSYCHFVQLHRAHFQRLALRFFSEVEQADDIAQDTLLKLWIGRERIASEQDFLALGTRITKNLCVNEWKRRQLQAVPCHNALPEFASNTDTAAALEHQENECLLQWALEQLPRREARIFRLWSEGAMDIQQIAATLGIKSTSVSNSLSKVKRKIYQLILSRQ